MGISKSYWQHCRNDLIEHIDFGANHVLDVGCAEGALGEKLKTLGLAREVTGIELSPQAATVAQSRLDRVYCGDIETMELKEIGIASCSYDYVICGDILEHLRDPWSTLQSLALLLKPGGRLIASIPNVRYWSVSFPLLFQGKWEYQEQGIMDRTHLRFFSLKTSIDLFEQAGLEIKRVTSLKHRKVDRLVSAISFGILDGIVAYQWLLVANKKNSIARNSGLENS